MELVIESGAIDFTQEDDFLKLLQKQMILIILQIFLKIMKLLI